MNKTIEQIASQHLGKAGDGTVVKPYITPTQIDKTLLVPVPRILNRTQYNIDENNLPFVGVDVWNAYEFSALTNNGFPVVGHLKLTYDALSPTIVESKSLKLYLNSFNMCKLGKTPFDVMNSATNIIEKDLKEIIDISVSANIFTSSDIYYRPETPIKGFYTQIDTIVSSENNIVFDSYTENPSILKGQVIDKNTTIFVASSALRSNCRVTNQPDWGDVFIMMTSKYKVQYETILQYIVSMRNENHFHEEICECIYKRFHDLFNPDELLVACLYTRRGGIDINPIRASSLFLIDHYCPNLVNAYSYTQKLWRQ